MVEWKNAFGTKALSFCTGRLMFYCNNKNVTVTSPLSSDKSAETILLKGDTVIFLLTSLYLSTGNIPSEPAPFITSRNDEHGSVVVNAKGAEADSWYVTYSCTPVEAPQLEKSD